MKNDGLLRSNGNGSTLAGVDAGLVDEAVLRYNGVVSFWDFHINRLAVGIEQHIDVVPTIAAGMVFQHETDEARLCGKEREVLTNEVGIAQAEGGMVLAQLYQAAVILKYLRILLFVLPVELVDAVG